jgi:aminoglycoside phosphotransferase (APT) family kinase protein
MPDVAADSDPPGRLIGMGRSADVYAIGGGRVLRRFRTSYDTQAEAEIMLHLAAAGFPVPEVYDADGPDLVMERLDGTDMLADLGRRPWRVRQHGRTLASLHDQLHKVQAPAGLRQRYGSGDRVLHMDLHPANVMLTSRGPVVIDWTGAAAGNAAVDVAMAYLIMASSEVDMVPMLARPAVRTVRARFIAAFLTAVCEDPWPHVAEVARYRMADPNVRPSEISRLRELAARAEQRLTADRR